MVPGGLASGRLVGAARQRAQLIRGLSTSLSRCFRWGSTICWSGITVFGGGQQDRGFIWSVGSPPPSHAASGEDPLSADPASRCLWGGSKTEGSADPWALHLPLTLLQVRIQYLLTRLHGVCGGAARQRVQLIRGLSTSLSRYFRWGSNICWPGFTVFVGGQQDKGFSCSVGTLERQYRKPLLFCCCWNCLCPPVLRQHSVGCLPSLPLSLSSLYAASRGFVYISQCAPMQKLSVLIYSCCMIPPPTPPRVHAFCWMSCRSSVNLNVADPGSGAFFTPGSGISFSGARIPNPYFWELTKKIFLDENTYFFVNWLNFCVCEFYDIYGYKNGKATNYPPPHTLFCCSGIQESGMRKIRIRNTGRNHIERCQALMKWVVTPG